MSLCEDCPTELPAPDAYLIPRAGDGPGHWYFVYVCRACFAAHTLQDEEAL